MQNWFRLTLASFICLNAISYADVTDLKLKQVREYSYYSNGKLSIERVYDEDEILTQTRYYYYGKYGISAIEEIIHYNKGNKNNLFAYEYKNGNLVKMHKTKEVWNHSDGTTKYEAVKDSPIEYQYNRYGNLVYMYQYSFSYLFQTRHEYDSSGKLTLVTVSLEGSPFEKAKCGYDSDGKLIEEVLTGDFRFPVNIKYEYNGNLLYSSNITLDGWLAVKAKYEYNSAGQLIRIYEFGYSIVRGYCRPLHSEIAFAHKQRYSFYRP